MQHRRHVGRLEDAKRRAIDRLCRQRHAVVELLLQHVRERRRLIEMPRLREIPRHQLDVAGAAAEGRHALAARPPTPGPRRVEGRDEDRRAGRSPAASSALACRLTKRSALLLLAIAVRSSTGTLRSSSRVSRTRMPSRASITPLTRRATASVRSFSFDAVRALARPRPRRRGRDRSRWCGWPTPAGRTTAAGRAAAAAAAAPRSWGLRRACRSVRRPGRSPGASWCRPAGSWPGIRRSAARDRPPAWSRRRGGRPRIRPGEPGARQRRVRHVERVGVELDRQVLGLLRDRAVARGVASIVSRPAAPSGS